MTDSDVKHQADSPAPTGNPSLEGDLAPSGNLYDFLKNEMAHRRGRRQQVFSWVSSLLVGITGGTIALTYTKGAVLAFRQKAVLTGAILILFGFSWFWISHHWREEIAVRAKLQNYYSHIVEPKKDDPPREDWTTILAIFWLAVAACFAVWLNP